MTFVFANDIPYDDDTELDPLEALDDTLAFSADDWSESRAMAWVWGIICGWDSEDPEADAMDELAARFGWTSEQVERLRELHRRFDALRITP